MIPLIRLNILNVVHDDMDHDVMEIEMHNNEMNELTMLFVNSRKRRKVKLIHFRYFLNRFSKIP